MKLIGQVVIVDDGKNPARQPDYLVSYLRSRHRLEVALFNPDGMHPHAVFQALRATHPYNTTVFAIEGHWLYPFPFTGRPGYTVAAELYAQPHHRVIVTQGNFLLQERLHLESLGIAHAVRLPGQHDNLLELIYQKLTL
jgi:hypothetical protein